MGPARFDGASLGVLILGPGEGESIIVRAPPDDWLVVDSCAHDGTSHTAEVLKRFGVTRASVLLSHPHLDHSKGFEEVLNVVTSGLVGCCSLWLDTAALTTTVDLVDTFDGRSARGALARIRSVWDAAPERKWVAHAGSELVLGEAKITVLAPSTETLKKGIGNPNALASPILLHWKNLKLLLGSDLDHSGWAQVPPPLADTHLLKVPHHGSDDNQHDVFLAGGTGRIFFLAPFFRHGLPSVEAGSGAGRLLNHVESLHVTNLPLVPGTPRKLPRSAVSAALRKRKLGKRSAAYEVPTEDERAGGWWSVCAADVDALVVTAGASAVEITRDP